jgi:hypothetical protein
MQLTAPAAGSIRGALAAAGAALLAPVTQAAAQDWKIDSALLYYQEGDGRVRAIEPVVSARRTDGNDRTWGVQLTYDSLTGASPNGAVPQPGVQTFTSPSGGSTYNIEGGRLPLDPSFHDTRVALNLSLEQPLWGAKLATSINFSTEYDFQSLGANAALAWDFNNRNTTLSLGAAFEKDTINPVGGTPQPLTPAFVSGAAGGGQETRNVTDLLVGLTQVMSRTWLVQANLGFGRGSGMHTDPYKILSVVDGTTGLVTGDRYVHELRPRSRSRTSLYLQSKTAFGFDVLDVSYRFYRDDWGIRSHTAELRYRFAPSGGWYVEPLLRAYRQTAADFWHGWLVEGSEWSSVSHTATVANASADPRLAAFNATTVGLKVGMPLGRASELSLRVASYRQTQKQPGGAPGALATLDLAPGLNATTVVLGYWADF